MKHNLFVLTEKASFVDHLREAVGEEASLIVCSNLEALSRQLDHNRGKAIFVHLHSSVIGERLPKAFLTDVQQTAGSTPIYAVADDDCSPRVQQLAGEMFDHCLEVPLVADDLKTLMRSEPNPVEEMAGMYVDLPHRELHGRTRSLVTFTPEMFEILDELKVPAAHDVTVLLIGETGAGKTYLARLIHEMSKRRDERFLTIACGALPPDLLESELFGYVKGAFTGADKDKEGKFAAAGAGTLLLDEIDVLPLEQQAKLLRVIETGEYEPVGSNETQTSQARLIVASNYDLEGLVKKGSFRMDLYYRLNTLCFRMLPLRKRPWDIEFLAGKFALEYSKSHGVELRRIEPSFLEALRRYSWPGNIRELENVVRRAVLYCQRGVLTADDLPSAILNAADAAPLVEEPPRQAANVYESAATEAPKRLTLEARVEETEKKIIEEALRRHNHHRTATAKELGISRVTLYNKMKKFGMMRPAYQE